jgi:hypothetical protein
MSNLHHARPQVNTHGSSTIAHTRSREKASRVTLDALSTFLSVQPWYTCDSASDLFERRYRLNCDLTDSQKHDIHDIHHIDLDGETRIEFTIRSQRVTIYPDDEALVALGEMTSEPDTIDVLAAQSDNLVSLTELFAKASELHSTDNVYRTFLLEQISAMIEESVQAMKPTQQRLLGELKATNTDHRQAA